MVSGRAADARRCRSALSPARIALGLASDCRGFCVVSVPGDGARDNLGLHTRLSCYRVSAATAVRPIAAMRLCFLVIRSGRSAPASDKTYTW